MHWRDTHTLARRWQCTLIAAKAETVLVDAVSELSRLVASLWRRAGQVPPAEGDLFDDGLSQEEPASAAVIFLHGLTGDVRNTWGVLPALIHKHTRCDVRLVGFPTSLIRSVPHPADLGHHLLTQLRVRCGSYERLVLVGHSLGGLIIQSAILFELEEGRADSSPVSKVSSIVLYAPPLEGSQFAAAARVVRAPLNEQARSLASGGSWLSELRGRWLDRVYRPIGHEVDPRYQRRIPTTIVAGLRDTIVPREAAQSIYRDPPVEVVDGDHSSLKLPKDERDLRYLVLFQSIAAEDRRGPAESPPAAPKGDKATQPGQVPARRWNLPYIAPRNTAFIGRDSELQATRARMRTPGTRPSLHVIRGPAGIGKSQFAIEFCYRYAAEFDVIWWLRCTESATLLADLAALASALQLPAESTAATADPSSAATRVHKWLAANPGWLVVFDDPSTLDAIRSFIPARGDGHILVTTREES